MAALVITPEIEAAAQQLAAATGQTPTEAVAGALRRELNERPARGPKNIALIHELLARIHAAPVDMSQSEDEILGYDEYGVPEQPYLGR